MLDEAWGCVEEGWIEHDGEDCPVMANELVRVKYSDGTYDSVCHKSGGFARDWDWYDGRLDGKNIIAYQVVSEKPTQVSDKPEQTISVQELVDKIKPTLSVQEERRKVVSDGGSSSYYKLLIKTKDGEFEAQVGDVIAAMVGDNFALGNVVKALRRIYLDSQGLGKVGVGMAYDIEKCKYFLTDYQERYGR